MKTGFKVTILALLMFPIVGSFSAKAHGFWHLWENDYAKDVTKMIATIAGGGPEGEKIKENLSYGVTKQWNAEKEERDKKFGREAEMILNIVMNAKLANPNITRDELIQRATEAINATGNLFKKSSVNVLAENAVDMVEVKWKMIRQNSQAILYLHAANKTAVHAMYEFIHTQFPKNKARKLIDEELVNFVYGLADAYERSFLANIDDENLKKITVENVKKEAMDMAVYLTESMRPKGRSTKSVLEIMDL